MEKLINPDKTSWIHPIDIHNYVYKKFDKSIVDVDIIEDPQTAGQRIAIFVEVTYFSKAIPFRITYIRKCLEKATRKFGLKGRDYKIVVF